MKRARRCHSNIHDHLHKLCDLCADHSGIRRGLVVWNGGSVLPINKYHVHVFLKGATTHVKYLAIKKEPLCPLGMFNRLLIIAALNYLKVPLLYRCLDYKTLHGCKVQLKNSATRVTVQPSDAEQSSRVTEFSIRTEQPLLILFLHNLPSAVAFMFEFVLLYQIYAKITTFFDQEMLGSISIDLRRLRRNVWRKMTTSERQNRQPDLMHECRLTRSGS